jgi:hypothetical protein
MIIFVGGIYPITYPLYKDDDFIIRCPLGITFVYDETYYIFLSTFLIWGPIVFLLVGYLSRYDNQVLNLINFILFISIFLYAFYSVLIFLALDIENEALKWTTVASTISYIIADKIK